jgi:hypothetical protein
MRSPPNSIAVDTGGNAGAPTLDARGTLRNAIPDIGAYEASSGSPTKLYWADDGGHRIRRSNADGSAVQTLVSGLGSPTGIAIDIAGGKVYWSDDTRPHSTRQPRWQQYPDADQWAVRSPVPGARSSPWQTLFRRYGALGSAVKRANLDGTACRPSSRGC